jgi:UDP-N-acetylglucosamine 2-epimerase (non-hydrolysing)
MNKSDKKIIYVLGTKAQFVKCEYILHNLINHNVDILILDTGQHKELTHKELNESGLKYEYMSLSNNNKNISSIFGMIIWFFKIIFSSKQKDKLDGISYSMVHGDTVSTLIGLIFSKRNNIKTIHLESGYKSNNILKPFPEELVRGIVSRFSDILVVDGDSQYNNILKFIKNKKIIRISRNTIYDSVHEFLEQRISPFDNTLTVTIHRTENIYNKKALRSLVFLLIDIDTKYKFDKIQWFCHDVTLNMLKKYNLIIELEKNEIIVRTLLTHENFIKELINSKLVITDGGSISEECSILGLNTIIWRDVVEDRRYLNRNVILSEYDSETIYNFMDNLSEKRNIISTVQSPSAELVDKLLKII